MIVKTKSILTLCRRYAYKASPYLGGYSFKNRSVAVEWIQTYFLASALGDALPLDSPSKKTSRDQGNISRDEGNSRDLGFASARSVASASDCNLCLSASGVPL